MGSSILIKTVLLPKYFPISELNCEEGKVGVLSDKKLVVPKYKGAFRVKLPLQFRSLALLFETKQPHHLELSLILERWCRYQD